MSAEMRQAVVLTDGEIPGSDFSLDLARSLRDAAPWGQGFPEPVFDGVFRVARERLVGGRHAKLELLAQGAGERSGSAEQRLDAIAFNLEPPIVTNPRGEVRMAYRLVVNAFRGEERPELIVEEIGAAP